MSYFLLFISLTYYFLEDMNKESTLAPLFIMALRSNFSRMQIHWYEIHELGLENYLFSELYEMTFLVFQISSYLLFLNKLEIWCTYLISFFILFTNIVLFFCGCEI